MNTGTGLGRLSASAERQMRVDAIENFVERAKVLGRLPGTHTLGKEFETPKPQK